MRISDNYIKYLKMHKDCNNHHISNAMKLGMYGIEFSGNDEAKKLKKMISEVSLEVHRMKGFIRLNPAGENILYGTFKPQNNIIPTLIEHFASRFPDTVIILGNDTESWAGIRHNGITELMKGVGLDNTLKEILEVSDINETSADIEKIWNVYYNGQVENCGNSKVHNHMPKKSMNAVSTITERKRGCKSIESYFA